MQPGSPVDRPARGGVPDGPAAPSAPEPRTPGSDAPESGADSVVIGGRYRLLTRSGPDEDTGAGRLSTWRARDNLLQRDVLLRIHAPGGPAARGLLDRALAAGVLSHPALAMVYDAVDEDRRAYVVSEWVDGQSLAQALTGGPLPEAYARETIRRVAEGVAQAHQVGLAVGGLVPERIILTRSGSVTVAAIPAPAADFAGDLRALGELLFATMAGFLPLTDDPVELDQQLTNASAPDLADAALAALDGRLQSAAELVAELVAHRRPGSLGESGGLSFITDRYEYDGPVTDVWPTISGPWDAASQDGPDAEAPREGEGRSSSGSSDRDPSEETTGRRTAGTGAPTRIWAAALSAGRRARRRRGADAPAADSQTAEPVAADSQTAEPVAADSQTAEPVAADSQTAEPVAADSQTAEPVAADRLAPPSLTRVAEADRPPSATGTDEIRRPPSPPRAPGAAGPEAPAETAKAESSSPGLEVAGSTAADEPVAAVRRTPSDTQPRRVPVSRPGGAVPPNQPAPAGQDAEDGDSGASAIVFGPADTDDRDGDYESEDAPESRRRTWLVLAFPVAALLAVVLIGWVLASSFRNVVGEPAAQTSTESVQSTTSSTTPTPTPTPTVEPGPVEVLGATVFDPFGDGEPENNDESPLAADADPATSWPTLTYRGSAALGNLKPGVGLVFDLGAPTLVSEVRITTDQPGATVEIRAGGVPTGTDLEPFPVAGQGVLDPQSTLAVDRDEPARYWIVWITELVPDGESFSASLAEVSFIGVPAG